MMNCLQLAFSYRPGGRKNAVQTLVRGLKSSVRCHLCCVEELGCNADELAGRFESITVLGRSSAGYLSSVRALHSLCCQHRIELIHAHDAASQFLAALVRLARPETKVIMTFHRSLGFESARRRDRVRNALACGLSAAIVTGSKERRAHFLAENYVSPRKMTVIPFGVDTSLFSPNPQARAAIRNQLGLREECTVVGTVGHFGPEKGVDIAIKAFGEVCRQSPERDIVLVVLGDGTPEQKTAIGQLTDRIPRGKVILAGFQRNVREWYSAFDMLLHTPRQEAFGLVVIEAMATKLPVIATRVGGVPELVRHGETGFLCQPGSPAELAANVRRLVDNPGLRARLAERAYLVAQKEYSARLYAERYLDLYRQVVAGRRRFQPRASGLWDTRTDRVIGTTIGT